MFISSFKGGFLDVFSRLLITGLHVLHMSAKFRQNLSWVDTEKETEKEMMRFINSGCLQG